MENLNVNILLITNDVTNTAFFVIDIDRIPGSGFCGCNTNREPL